MTEGEWLLCADPIPMLHVLRDQVSDRKFRLFAVACRRRIGSELAQLENDFERLQETVESLVDEPDGLHRLEQDERTNSRYFFSRYVTCYWSAELANDSCVAEASSSFNSAICSALDSAWGAGGGDTEGFERNAQANLLRDIFGNPFCFVTADSRWFTETAVVLATGIYAERAFDRMPILADALEDAGCDNADILNHCRGDGTHVRGCWVVDLVLGKQ